MPEIHLHLGAHKTASTYIQNVLYELRSEIAMSGIYYEELGIVRPAISNPVAMLSQEPRLSVDDYFKRRHAKKALAQRLSQSCAGEHDMLLSDENLLGHAQDCLGGQLYPNASAQLQVLAGLLPAEVSRIYLGVREYMPFLASVYIEALRWGTNVRPEEMVAAYTQKRWMWSELIAKIRSIFPEAQIYLWRFEDFKHLRMQILSLISRLDTEMLAKVPDLVVNAGLSKAAVEALANQFDGVNGPISKRFEVLRAQSRYPLNSAKDRFNPWPDAQAREFSSVYEEEFRSWQRDPALKVLVAADIGSIKGDGRGEEPL